MPALVNKLCDFFKAYYKSIAHYLIIGVKTDPSAVIFWQNEIKTVNEKKKNTPTILPYKKKEKKTGSYILITLIANLF